MTFTAIYLISLIVYAVLYSVLGWIYVKHDNGVIRVRDIMWTALWGIVPVINTLGVLVAIGFFLADLGEKPVFGKNNE